MDLLFVTQSHRIQSKETFSGPAALSLNVWRRRSLSTYLHRRVHHSFASGPPSNWCLLKSFTCKHCGGSSRKIRPRELLVANEHQHQSFTLEGKECQPAFKRNHKPSHITRVEVTRNLIEVLGRFWESYQNQDWACSLLMKLWVSDFPKPWRTNDRIKSVIKWFFMGLHDGKKRECIASLCRFSICLSL